MSPALNENSEISCFECNDTIEICNGMMFIFYPGLPLLSSILTIFGVFVYKHHMYVVVMGVSPPSHAGWNRSDGTSDCDWGPV